MAVVAKCTFFLRYKQAGISFSLWQNAPSLEALTLPRPGKGSIIDYFLSKYMPLLGAGVECPYVRLSDETVTGDSLFFDRQYITINQAAIPTTSDQVVQVKTAVDDTPDFANTAINIALVASSTQKGRIFQRFIPDSVVNFPIGLNPPQQWVTAFNAWVKILISDAWAIRCLVDERANPRQKIVSVVRAAPGDKATITTQGNHGLVPNNIVRVGRVVKTANVNGIWTVFTTPTTQTAVLSNTEGPQTTVGAGGYIRKREFNYPTITNATFRAVTGRRAGRPFGLSVGRRKKIKT